MNLLLSFAEVTPSASYASFQGEGVLRCNTWKDLMRIVKTKALVVVITSRIRSSDFLRK